MVVKIAGYNREAGTYNVESEETKWTDYRIIARLNEPAEAIMTLADPTGALVKLYIMDGSIDLAGAVADDGVKIETIHQQAQRADEVVERDTAGRPPHHVAVNPNKGDVKLALRIDEQARSAGLLNDPGQLIGRLAGDRRGVVRNQDNCSRLPVANDAQVGGGLPCTQ